ncbi:MAG TPA: hypothetical protein VK548_28125 [Candidatus Acidoferrum sp.]|nr:hypothetical protein [Candidatus Acidoferrum sp.]
MKVCGQDIRVEGRLIRVARLEADSYEFLEDPPAAIESLREANVRIDLFTFMQRLPETTPRFDYPLEWDNVAAVPVSTFEHWWNHQINFKVRNKVRLAEKRGVSVRAVPYDDAFVQGISEIYNESPLRQGRPFRHYGKDIESIRKESGTFRERTVFFGAFLEGRMIGFAKLVSDDARGQAGLMQILSMNRHRDKAPTNALVAEAVRSCADRGIPYLVYSQFAYGKKQRDSLSDFKEANGFTKIEIPRYYVPLTIMGRLALRWGLHHKLADRVPETVAARLRRLRTRWYARRLEVAKEAV